MNECGRSKGFTLLEVLIAVTIMTLVVTVVYASFETAGRNVAQADAVRSSLDLGRTLLAKIATDVSNAYFSSAMNAKTTTTVFSGKKGEAVSGNTTLRTDSLSLTTLTNWRQPNTAETDLWEVDYFFKQKPDGTGQVFYRRENRLPGGADSPALEGGTAYEITDRVAGLQFRYNTGSQWVDEWDASQMRAVPKEVEITIVLNDGSSYGMRVEVGR